MKCVSKNCFIEQLLKNSDPTFLCVNFILVYIPRHSKICHLTVFSFTYKDISCCQVAMDNLAKNKIILSKSIFFCHSCLFSFDKISFLLIKSITYIKTGIIMKRILSNHTKPNLQSRVKCIL